MVNPTSVLVTAYLLISPLVNAMEGRNEHKTEYSPK